MQRLPGVDWPWTLSIGLSVLLSACTGDDPGQPTDLPPGAPAGLSVSPILVVGERPNDTDHELYRVVTPFLLPDGGIGVPLSSEGSIRIFGEQGEFVRSLGSPGQGPGEFVDLVAAWAREDTIEALGYGLNRVTRFVPGKAPETILLDDVASAQSGVPGLTDGSWVRFGVKEVQ
ncbi:MAG: 6-bladed beta-propeller, partial [Thioalkalivibrio sp.]|nr:6-bladed beta-propeller [Thioalkalivibrio sp.]